MPGTDGGVTPECVLCGTGTDDMLCETCRTARQAAQMFHRGTWRPIRSVPVAGNIL